MGKYQDRESTLQSSSSRSILVVDDLSIRKNFFKKSADLMKKIEKVEQDRDNFFSQDQHLFNSWMELTFRKEREQHQTLIEEYKSIATFHNQMVALSEMLEISMPEAYAILKEEEKILAQGSENEIQQILKLREEREKFAQEAMEELFSFDEAEALDEEEIDFSVDPLSTLSEQEQEFRQEILEMSLEDLQEILSGYQGQYFLMEAFDILSRTSDTNLLLKIWDLAPEKVRRKTAQSFRKEFGVSLENILEEMRQLNDFKKFSESKEDQSQGNSTGERLKDSRKPNTSVVDEETEIKSAYRKLVRLIHPDSQDPKASESLKKWYGKIWNRVQEAYKSKNLTTLKRLEMLVALRLQDLRSLTLEEIRESAQWLERELSELNFNFKELRKHPAWRFSNKRSYDKLKAKVKKEILKDMEPLMEDLSELKEAHRYFESIAATYGSLAKARLNKTRPKKRTGNSGGQRSFFDE